MSWTLPQSFYDNLDLCYLEAFKALEENVNNSNNKNQKIKLLEDFTKKYMMPHEAWKFLLELKNCLEVSKTIIIANYGFFIDENGFIDNPSACMLINSLAEPSILTPAQSRLIDKKNLQRLEICLKIPSARLDDYLWMYEKYSSSPFDKKLLQTYVENMKELYQKIKASEDDIVTWMELITTVGDENFIKINIENRLSHDLTNKKLWQLYIQFLKANNPKEMLQVYSKYCRFFICDGEMKQKYRRKLKKYGPVALRWENPLIFEKLLGCEPNRMYRCPPSPTYVKIDSSPLCQSRMSNISFYYPQGFLAFRYPLIRYILMNANGTILSKLHQSCKLFFINWQILPCYRFVLKTYSNESKGYQYVENSIQYSSHNVPNFDAKNIYINTSLYAYNTNENMLSEFINKKFYKCDAKHIEISFQKLTEKEFDFLVDHGNVETCHLKSVKIWKNDGELMERDEILKKMPKIRSFVIQE